jgi:glucoamylase
MRINSLFLLSIIGAILPVHAPMARAGALAPTAHWSYAGKTGVGTAYAPYGAKRAASKVWYSAADGYLTETMYGQIHEAQIASARLAVRVGRRLILEGRDTVSRSQWLDVDARGRPQSPALKLTTRARDGSVEIEKDIFTDPDRDVLVMRVIVRPLKGGATPFLVVEPHMDNSAAANLGSAARRRLSAHQGRAFLSVEDAQGFVKASAGPVADGPALASGAPSRALSGPPGAVLLTAQLSGPARRPQVFDLAFGFGASDAASDTAARESLAVGFDALLSRFEGRGGEADGWRAYLKGLTELDRLADQATDGGRLAYASALALKTAEDKLHPGALIASLSNPWGETVAATAPSTGYKAVWPRDFYECAMALAALGDRETPVMALRYLKAVQVTAKTPGADGAFGWFQQKSEVDGTAEWYGVQLDQTAMPIMLAWKLNHLGFIDDAALYAEWRTSLKSAADFLVTGGPIHLKTNRAEIHPPWTQMERWEEKEGYSPSTTAAEITGLTLAADIARRSGDLASAETYQKAADAYSAAVETRMAVPKGALADHPYYIRISKAEQAAQSPDITAQNGQGAIAADQVVDAGFLELVRYGVRKASDPLIADSLKVIDDQSLKDDLRVRYDVRFKDSALAYPAFRRYGHDGYGEDTASGGDYGGQTNPAQRGRLWPLLTGERGHYEIALASENGKASPQALQSIRLTYAGAMEHFANQGLMLPEQVFDGVGADLPHHPALGQGTGSATPLSWAHAEYIKLLRSLADGAVFDLYGPVKDRYAR